MIFFLLIFSISTIFGIFLLFLRNFSFFFYYYFVNSTVSTIIYSYFCFSTIICNCFYWINLLFGFFLLFLVNFLLVLIFLTVFTVHGNKKIDYYLLVFYKEEEDSRFQSWDKFLLNLVAIIGCIREKISSEFFRCYI